LHCKLNSVSTKGKLLTKESKFERKRRQMRWMRGEWDEKKYCEHVLISILKDT